MSEKPTRSQVSPPTDVEKANAFRFLVGAIKATLLGKFYDYVHHSFLDPDIKVLNVPNHYLSAPLEFQKEIGNVDWKLLRAPFKMWCPVLFGPGDKKTLTTLQFLLGDVFSSLSNEDQAKAKEYADPTFYMAAVLVVYRQLNTIQEGNHFREAFLTLKGLPADTHFVFRNQGGFKVPKTTAKIDTTFGLITKQEAIDIHDQDGYAKVVEEVSKIEEDVKLRPVGIRKSCSNKKIVVYIELEDPTNQDSKLLPLSKHSFILTDNFAEQYNLNATAAKTMPVLIGRYINDKTITLPLEGDNSGAIPVITTLVSKDVTPQGSSTKKPTAPKSDKKGSSTKKPTAPKSDKKGSSTRKKDVEMPPPEESTGPKKDPASSLDPKKREEERVKQVWAEDTSAEIASLLLNMCVSSKKKANILGYLNVAAGLSAKKTKVGGTIFNLHTTRLLKRENDNTGIIIADIDAAPLFPGRKIGLAINIKNTGVNSVKIPWFKKSEVGTNINLTSNNKDLVAWVREQLIPRVWEQFATVFIEDVAAMNEINVEDVDNEEERVSKVASTEQDESDDEVKVMYRPTFNVEREIGFTSGFAARLPIITDDLDVKSLGGDLAALRKKIFSVNTAAMNMDAGEINQLKIVKSNMASLFKPESQKIIESIRRNIRVDLKEPVKFNGTPFEMENVEEGEAIQFNVDYRARAVEFEPPQAQEADFDDEDEDE